MKNKFTNFSILMILGVLVSCVSLQDREMLLHEKAGANIIGSVEVKFTSFQPFHFHAKNSLKNKAYSELMREARKQYSGNIELKNIMITGSGSAWEGVWAGSSILLGFLVPAIIDNATYSDENNFGPWFGMIGAPVFLGGMNLAGNFQKITATADVILLSGTVGIGKMNQEKMGNILTNVTQTLTERLPNNSTIAILSITYSDKNDSEFIIDELEYRMVNSGKFSIVDRRRLDQIRNELNFQMSGDVDDNSAISIGNMLGANIVITGNVTTGTTQYLNIKALDVKTARIIAMAREQL